MCVCKTFLPAYYRVMIRNVLPPFYGSPCNCCCNTSAKCVQPVNVVCAAAAAAGHVLILHVMMNRRRYVVVVVVMNVTDSNLKSEDNKVTCLKIDNLIFS